MGKNTDKMYVTHSEHSGMYGAHGASGGITARKVEQTAKQLPFQYCSLSLQPFRTPVCVVDEERRVATVFDLVHIVPYVRKHGKNPVTGEPLTVSQLLRLHFHRRPDGESSGGSSEYVDPVTGKVLTDHTHVVAIRTSGNVYSWDTVERLNIRAKNWHDLVSGEAFTRRDILTIQDPHNLAPRDMTSFQHLRPEARVEKAQQAVERVRREAPPSSQAKTQPLKSLEATQRRPDHLSSRSKGLTAASFTSTAFTPRTKVEYEEKSVRDWLCLPHKVKAKGYVQLSTSLGDLNLELLPEQAPLAAYNFIYLAKKGYYNKTIFHRNIKGFMIQGGDPAGNGSGGTSIWNDTFKDETNNSLSHDTRGIVSMANRGPDTNGSQFFITYGPAKHLDKKHTIFGRLVGGADTLDTLEKQPVGARDRPKQDIVIETATVFVDPFEPFLNGSAKLDQPAEGEARQEQDNVTWTGRRLDEVGKTNPAPVGRYLKTDVVPPTRSDTADSEEIRVKKRQKLGFGNFDNW